MLGRLACWLALASCVASLSLKDYVSYPGEPSDDHGERIVTIGSKRMWLDNAITLCSHLTVDRLATFLRDVVPAWSGPISLAIYMLEGSDELPNLDAFRLDGHAITVLYPNFSDPHRLRYPINRLRNLALHQAPTRYVLSLDADFIPSPIAQTLLRAHSVPLFKASTRLTAIIVPCFKLSNGSTTMPAKRQHAYDLYRSGHLQLTDALAGHGPTRPLLALSPSSSAHHHYGTSFETQMEPYVMMRRSEHPLYDERFTDQGGDKQSHSMLLNALGADFKVVRDVWVVHPPIVDRSWPADREATLPDGHFSSAQSDTKRFRYFEDWLPEMERRVGGATKLRWPNGRSAQEVALDPSFGRPSFGLLFGL